MKTRFKIYLAVLAMEVVLGVALFSVDWSEVPPTSPFTADDVQQIRQSRAVTNKP